MSIFGLVTGFVKDIIGPAERIIDELHVSKEEKIKAKTELAKATEGVTLKMFDFLTEQLKAQKEIIMTELKGTKFQSSWRPLLMYLIIAILFNNYLFAPYLKAFGLVGTPVLHLPDKLWNLLTVGLGGYVVGRSGEAMVRSYAGAKKE